MLWVVDKKVIRHTIDAGTALVEVPIRIRFEYCLRDERFVEGTVKRDFLYNRPELLRRFARLEPAVLDADIEDAVDRTIVEHLKFAGYATGDVKLFPAQAEDTRGPDQEDAAPAIILPGGRGARDRRGGRSGGAEDKED